ncbi:Protein phosphatase 1 regulatory subunit 35 [Nibea albiflora]|uniref:Protein phosphatase 1 regulatory subunit 35 n=1 Tax=Nibea albiflora TaxID=240163 RepID=A0ACB7EXY9_NIBAL|nr:Protein phosphatase 1 regulatory subunit 35 [Nibea albiflora]
MGMNDSTSVGRFYKQGCFEVPVVVTVTSEPHMTLSRDSQLQQPIKAQRRSRGRHHVVNVSRSQLLFTSLVSLDVQEDELISQVLQDRLLLAPPIQCHGNKTVDGPSPLIFMTPDLLRQKPLPPVEEPEYVRPCPIHYHAHSTFDLYRQQRRCEATP